MNSIHIISQEQTLLDALCRINEIKSEPLVLFAIDAKNSTTCRVQGIPVL